MAVVLGGEGKPAQDWGPFSDSHGSSHRQCGRGHHPTVRPDAQGSYTLSTQPLLPPPEGSRAPQVVFSRL